MNTNKLNGLELKVPPVVVFFFAVLGVFLSPQQLSFYAFIGDYTKTIGVFVFAVGVFIGVMGVVNFKQAKTTVNPVNISKASSLVTGGVFRITRNPMYLGMSFGILGAGVFLQSHWITTLLFVFLFVAYLTQFQIKPEERKLLELFGDGYEKYMQSTRRWL